MRYPIILCATLLAQAYARPTARDVFTLHEERLGAPSSFILSGPAPADTPLNLRIALVQGNMAGLEQVLYDVSTPGSASYGKHLSKAEVEKYVAPDPASVDAVQQWLASKQIIAKTISPAGDWMSFTTTVQQANELFNAEFNVFKHVDTGAEAVRTLAYSIPTELKGHLGLVHPTISFPNPYGGKVHFTSPLPTILNGTNAVVGSNGVPASCASTITPACLQALYGIPKTPATQDSNRLLVTGYIEQYANEADLKSFLTDYRPDIPSGTTFKLQAIDGGQNLQDSSKAGIEANLDVQYTIGVATGVPTDFLTVGSQFQDGGLEGFLDTVNFVMGEDVIPHVMTTSYGMDESDVSPLLANNLCNGYMQLGARGTSVFFASGDGGVTGSQFNPVCVKFVPTFPSGCPFLTSVGSTKGISETASSFSSGGFSNYFSTPDYQSAAVKTYQASDGLNHLGLYNSSGRGYPDVSAQGENFMTYYQGKPTGVSGTSASSPVFASVIALLNDRLIAAGKPPLGFLNPFLYQAGAQALNDVTSGRSEGCAALLGFEAKAGWDPVTGLGTPNFAKLLATVGL